ncbi:MAG: hypothetical protein ACOYXT_21575 [Bacteroidota bacterium]
MFTSGQYIGQKLQNQPLKAVFQHGTALARRKIVKRRFTYKELTLVLGIVVALLIVFTWWFKNPAVPAQNTGDNHRTLPVITLPTVAKGLVKSALEIIF